MDNVLAGAALCWGCAPKATLVQLADLASRHRFGEISARPSHYFSATPSDIEQFRERGVRVGVLDALLTYLPGSPDPLQVDPSLGKHMRNLDDCLEAAVALGARCLNVAHYLGDPNVSADAIADSAREIATRCAASGVNVCLEFIPETGIPDLDTARDIVTKVGQPNVGILFDTWHFLRAGGRPSQLADLEVISEMQISDRVPPPPDEPYVPMTGRLAPGEGEAPLVDLVRKVRAVHPDLAMSVEVFSADVPDLDEWVERLARGTAAVLIQAAGL